LSSLSEEEESAFIVGGDADVRSSTQREAHGKASTRVNHQAVALTVAETEMRADLKRPTKKGWGQGSHVALLASLALGLLFADPAKAANVRGKYTIFYLGLPVGEMETVKTFDVSTYQTSVDARVAGIATIVSNFKMNMKSNGTIRKSVIQPSNFAAEETGSAESQSMRMTLVGGSVKSAEVVPLVRGRS
jgi:Protein of unknown function (DUF3108)